MSASFWPLGAAWLCLHMWEHYRFSQDRQYLANAYDTMKESAQFLLDYLIEDESGRLITCPSVSPENTYQLPGGESGVLCAGASMDFQIIEALFKACIQSAEIIGRDEAFREELRSALNRLPGPQIGKYGQIQEWMEDYEEVEPGHRHISHLFALYPGMPSQWSIHRSWRQLPVRRWNADLPAAEDIPAGAGRGSLISGRGSRMKARLIRMYGRCWSIPPCRIYSITIHRSRLTGTSEEQRASRRCCCRVIQIESDCCLHCLRTGTRAVSRDCGQEAAIRWTSRGRTDMLLK